jgi:DNA-binding NarL/FixJ family response regulator
MDGSSRAPVPVLVADDDPLMRGVIRTFLDGIDGVEVVGSASDGAEAVEMAHDRHPQVVVMDVQMPRMNGVEATRHILHESPGTRVVILTGVESPACADAALRAGAVAFVRKDREAPEIYNAILSATTTTW